MLDAPTATNLYPSQLNTTATPYYNVITVGTTYVWGYDPGHELLRSTRDRSWRQTQEELDDYRRDCAYEAVGLSRLLAVQAPFPPPAPKTRYRGAQAPRRTLSKLTRGAKATAGWRRTRRAA